ncbi:MAG: Maf family protein, partial [Oscillibacter sp.]|nr:Maf family protein [Oscillibacter sp.]
MKLVLASGSPRRRDLLRQIGLTDFAVRVPDVEERVPEGLSPRETVEAISRQKAQAVRAEPGEVVVTADTMVFLDGMRLGKPRDESDALRMLTALQGRTHTVCTGVTVRQGARLLTRSEATEVTFRP